MSVSTVLMLVDFRNGYCVEHSVFVAGCFFVIVTIFVYPPTAMRRVVLATIRSQLEQYSSP